MFPNFKTLIPTFITVIFLIFTYMTPVSDAHILIIADSNLTDSFSVVNNTADILKSKGYNVLELYGENATTKNIAKGMYNADAVIYAGHGGYAYGNYNDNGGPAEPPFALVGSNGYIWGVGDQMHEGKYGKVFQAPFKKNIPVILYGTCFSSGWVDNKQVANPIETIYSFSEMFTGANYYATNGVTYYHGKPIIDIMGPFLNGANNFGDANEKSRSKITQATVYNGETIWHNINGKPTPSFVGDWNGTFPQPNQTKPYNSTAAEKWYDGDIPPSTENLVSETATASDSNLSDIILNSISSIMSYIQNIVISYQ